MNRSWAPLQELLGARLTFGAPLAALTTLGVGGPARILARPDNEVELAATLKTAREVEAPIFILGLGSNLLFDDAGFDGLVIKLGGEFRMINLIAPNLIRAGAGAPCAEAVMRGAGWGLTGLECLAGIPSTLGGAVSMNAGSFGGEIGPLVEEVRYLDREGLAGRLQRDQMDFTYRRFRGLPDGAALTRVDLKLASADGAEVAARVEANLAARRAKQPKGVRSAGSVFKNPPGDSAGRLIEACGFKGQRVGGAEVSEVHANFIINRGGAKSADILELIRRIVETVRDKKGFTLEPEIKIVSQR